jgi:phospholipid-binding lipoprotein MlaA
MVADDATVPLHFVSYPYRTEVTITVGIVGGLNERETVAKSYEALLNDATDPYATLRSTYMQFREAEIRGDKALPALPDFDETPAPGATPSPTPTTDTASPPAPTAAPVPSSDAPAADPAGPPPSPDAAMPANPTPAPGPAPQDYPDMRGLF